MWSRREFRRNDPPDPNTVINEVSDGASTADSEKPQPDRGGRRSSFESQGNFTGQNADGNREIFLATFKSSGWKFTQVTSSVAPVQNIAGNVAMRGRIFSFSSNGNYAGTNADLNREIFIRDKEGFEQITDTTVDENVNVDVNPRGRFVTFESTSNVEVDGTVLTNRRVMLFDRKNGQTRVISRSFFGNNFKPRISSLIRPIRCAVQRRRFPVGESPTRQGVAPAGSSRGGERR